MKTEKTQAETETNQETETEKETGGERHGKEEGVEAEAEHGTEAMTETETGRERGVKTVVVVGMEAREGLCCRLPPEGGGLPKSTIRWLPAALMVLTRYHMIEQWFEPCSLIVSE